MDACEHIVDATHMIDVEIALVMLVVRRVDIGNDAIVYIPRDASLEDHREDTHGSSCREVCH